MVDFAKKLREMREKQHPSSATGEEFTMRYNQVTIAGRLVRDPEVKFSPNGTQIAKMRLAYDQGGGDSKSTGYIDVTAFQKVAENAGKYLKKGSPVLVGGRIEYREWEADGGGKRSAVGIAAHDIQFLEGKKSDGEGGASGGNSGQSGPSSDW
jgi:single-strand DNA-binding protein